jgi:hypothetical protein
MPSRPSSPRSPLPRFLGCGDDRHRCRHRPRHARHGCRADRTRAMLCEVMRRPALAAEKCENARRPARALRPSGSALRCRPRTRLPRRLDLGRRTPGDENVMAALRKPPAQRCAEPTFGPDALNDCGRFAICSSLGMLARGGPSRASAPMMAPHRWPHISAESEVLRPARPQACSPARRPAARWQGR